MLLLGYDLGSSSVKAAIVDSETGRCTASCFYPESEAPIKSLRPGWAEQSPAYWWECMREVTAKLLASGNVDPADIAAIGISYQMHGLVAVDRDMNPLRDAIIWCDSRGVPYGEKAFAELGSEICLSHLLNSPGNFTASKLRWVKENEPDVFERIHKVLLPGDFIAMKMTGEAFTTVEGLSEYMLWDFSENTPARFLLDYFGFPEDLLPETVPTFSRQGTLTPEAASHLGLRAGIPVTYRAGDQPNNALSLNVFNPGEIASTAGTSGVVYGINPTTGHDPLSRVNNFAHVNHTASAPRIGVMTCINGTGILNSWMKRNVAQAGISYSDMNRLAAEAPVGSEGVTVLPFGNGAERVLLNRCPGCSFHGIDFNRHDRRHLLRAAQEGIVFSFYYGIEIMKSIGLPVGRIHAAHANMFLSDVFRSTLATVADAEIVLLDTDGAVGAARGAGLGAGIYASPAEAFSSLRSAGVTEPDADRDPCLEAYARWKEVLESSADK